MTIQRINKLNFYKKEKNIDEEIEKLETDLQPMKTEDFVGKGAALMEATNNYDPIVGNKILGSTMPLPKKNNLLESNRKMEEIKNKKSHEINKKKIKVTQKHDNKRICSKTNNYILENKKKVRKDSSKRKRSAKGRDPEKRLIRDMGITKTGLHRKSYSEVVRDTKKNDKFLKEEGKKKDVVINWQNIYNFNIQNSQLVNSKNASIQYFSNKGNKHASSQQTNIGPKRKQELFEKGLKKFSQGYTVNKLAKEGLLNRMYY